MKSQRARQYIAESLTIEGSDQWGLPEQDAIRAVEISESDNLQECIDQNRKDLNFIEDMLDHFDRGDACRVRQLIVDWRDDLEHKIASQKRELNR